VEDERFSIDPFGPRAAPGSPSTPAGYVTASQAVEGDPVAYWWAKWPSSDSAANVSTSAASSVGPSCAAPAGGLYDTVGESLEAVEPFVDSEESLGIRATFAGSCDFGRPRSAQLVFRCDSTAWAQAGLLPGVAVRPWAPATGPLEVTFAPGGRPSGRESCEEVVLEWRTLAACPMCSSEDFAAVADARCEDGRRTFWFRAKAPCAGGDPAPAPYTEPCGRFGVRLLVAVVGGPTALVLLLACGYLARVRRRYAKYMALEGPGQEPASGAPATSIGAAETWE